MLRKTPLKRGNSSLKKSSLKKQSSFYKAKAPERKKRGDDIMTLFELHWNTHPTKRCENCDRQLWGENNTCYHHHLLEKSSYPEYALDIDCLALVCPECHNAYHGGNLSEKFLSLLEEAKTKLYGKETT